MLRMTKNLKWDGFGSLIRWGYESRKKKIQIEMI